jgi:hypothetical protein
VKGRFVIRYTTVREGQKHSDLLFATNNPATARAWLQMGEFIVWDRMRGELLYLPLCLDFAVAMTPMEKTNDDSLPAS